MSSVATPPRQQQRKLFSIRPVIGGLKMDQDTVTVDPHYCVIDSNWLFYNGECRKRPGLATVNTAVLVSSSTYVMGAYRFRLTDGTVRQVACTPTKVFQLSSGAQTDITGTALTGGNVNFFSYCVANNELIFANGVDALRRWNGTAGTVSVISGSGAPSSAKYVESFVDRVVCAGTIEGGITYPQRIRWSNNASNTTWNGTSSGYADLLDTQGWVTGIKKLKEDLVVYKDDSIALGTPTGIASSPITFRQKVSFHGTISGQTVCDIGGAHLFLGRDNVYIFDGVEAVSIGDQIREELFTTTDFAYLQYAHGQIKDDRREYWIFVTATGDTVPKRAWCYNYHDRTWSRHSFSTGIVSSSLYATDDTITIDQLVGTIDEQTWTFDSRTILAQTPFLAVGATDGYLYYLNPNSASDNGTTITASLETADLDFGVPGTLVTLSRIGCKVRNIGTTNMKLGVSTDGGATYTEKTASFTPGSDRYSNAYVDVWKTAPNIRVRVKNDDSAGAAFTELLLEYRIRGRSF